MPTIYRSFPGDAKPKLEDSSQSESKRKAPTSDVSHLRLTSRNANHILFKATAVFPFDFFPDELVIDRNKVDIIHRKFFLSREVSSIPIRNINGVISSTSAFFGQISFEVYGLLHTPEPIEYLWNQDAVKARRIINGLILANKEGIDVGNIPVEYAKSKLEQIGQAQEDRS